MRRGRERVAFVVLAVTALTALTITGCSDDDYGGTPPQQCTPGAAQVCMAAATFNPANITVTAGTTVQWLNTSGVTHSVTSVSATETFDQDVPSGAGGFSHQFSTAGTYEYYCTFHGTPTSGMRGTITVN